MLLTNMAWSVIYVEIKRMTMPKVLSQIVQKFWNEWELRLMLLVSLTMQLLLVYVGRRRLKFTGLKFTVLAWLVYLLADWFATVILSSLLRGDIGSQDRSLVVFWTPFLLWHLGSPFNITAYSLEDNEIWLRHLLAMIIQSVSALYICVRFWRRSVLAFMAVPLLISGIFKYGERIWALREASEKRLVDSIFSSKMREDEDQQDVIGQRMIRTGMVSGAETEGEIGGERLKNLPLLDNLRLAHHSYYIFKPLFADLPFGISKETFDAINISSKSAEDAFELVEIELRFLYDTLYTKVPWQQSKRFIAFHAFCFFSAVAALLGFSLVVGRSFFSAGSWPKFKKVDIAVTYLLLTGAIALDIYSAVVLSVSNWTIVRWARPKNWLQRLYARFVASRVRKRSSQAERAEGGSETMAQHDLVNYFVQKRRANAWDKSAGVLDTANLMQKYTHTHWTPVTPDLKRFIFSCLLAKMKKKSENQEDPTIRDTSWERTTDCFDKFLEEDIRNFLKPKGFVERIFTWHIATNMLYYNDHDTYPHGALGPYCEISKRLSDYMMYLVLMKPMMLPRGFNEVINRDTCKEAKQLFPQEMDHHRGDIGFQRTRKVFISSMLGVIKATNAPVVVPGKKMSALLDGCFLASQVKALMSGMGSTRYDHEEKWEMVSRVWMEMMAYAASKCAWREHAKELIHGGELLSYVSLIMAHLGLTDRITPIHPDRLTDLHQSRLLR